MHGCVKFLLCLCLSLNVVLIDAVYAEQALTAVTTEHRLLQYSENDKLKGPSAEIFKLLLEKSQLHAPVEFFPWSRAYKTALERKNTLIFSMVRTQEREDKFHWLVKVSELVRGFISLKSRPENYIRNIDDAKTKVIAVLRNSYGFDSLIKLGFEKNKQLYEVTSIKDGITLFLSGKVDLFYTDLNVVKNHLASQNKNSDDIVSIHILPQTRRDSYIAANIDTNSKILANLKDAANELISDPDYQYHLAYKPLIDE